MRQFASVQAIEQPVRTNQIPRQIPEQSFFTKPIPGIVMGGILPFGCIFIQLFFILNSIWYKNRNSLSGFCFCATIFHISINMLFVSGLIRCTTCLDSCSWFSSFCSSPALRQQFCSATSTFVLRYLNFVCPPGSDFSWRVIITLLLNSNKSFFVLCVKDYHWWWRSFLTSGFTAVYLFIYAVHYFFSKLQIIGMASTILYFGYTMIMVLIFFLFTGEVFTFWKWALLGATVSILLPWHIDGF